MTDWGSLASTILHHQVNIPLLHIIHMGLLKVPVIGAIVYFFIDWWLPTEVIANLILWKPLWVLLVIPGFGALGGALLFLPWAERKLVGRMQWRVGPREIAPRSRGSIQLLADSLRFLCQEVIIHKDAHRLYFLQFPFLYFLPVLLPLLFINSGVVGHPLVPIETPYALQIMAGLISLMPVFILGVGWSSNNRFAFIGTVREAFMYFAYEVPFILVILAMIVLYGTSNTVGVVNVQSNVWWWGIIQNPLAALTFFIAAVMATARLPFEIPEADQELAFGPFIEYSGIAFGLAYVMAYEKMYVLGAIMTMLFLGGGSGVFIPYITPYLGDFMYCFWFFIKVFIIMVLMVILRGVYARYRLDQALSIGWCSILILALVALFWSIILGGIIL